MKRVMQIIGLVLFGAIGLFTGGCSLMFLVGGPVSGADALLTFSMLTAIVSLAIVVAIIAAMRKEARVVPPEDDM